MISEAAAPATIEHVAGVTVVVVRTVRVGHEAECEAWMHGIAAVALRYPGHLGITIFRPRPGSRDFTFVFRFDTPANLEAWDRSAERADWVQRAEAFTERVHIQKLTGLETWFPSPDGSVAVPPRWKMIVVTWCVAFPLLQILSLTVGKLIADVPALPRGAIFGLVMVLCMTLAMPYVTKALRGWLYPPPPA
ncbi:MAG: putative rane protein [Deltaproteobacteria bacterium]|nr:putative rane protein [Deltaproteobacteria bacterium]